jgi:hypothetical protein
MMAAAAMAAGAGIKIAFLRDAAEFKGLADVLRDGFLHFVHVFLRVEKALGDWVVHERFAELLEIGDFPAVQGQAGLLLLLQVLAFDHQGLVLAAKFLVGHEVLDAPPDGLDLGLVQNGLAEFPGFVDDGAFFSLSLHDFGCFAPSRGIPPSKASVFNTPQLERKIK